MISPRALDGIRVLDFGQYVAGPLAAMLLADHGADVIRIDPPGGPRYDTPANATWNRGKRSIVLDLKDAKDREIARKLMATADVAIENFRPGVMDRLGLGSAAMTSLNPRLIYCSIPGFGSDDPRAQVRAWEGVVASAAGIYSTHPAVKADNPVYNALPYCSSYGAILAVMAIAAALNARARSGTGQVVEAPMFDAVFTAFSGKVMRVHSETVPPSSSNWWHGRCTDGRWFMYVGSKKVLKALLDGLGRGSEYDENIDLAGLARKFSDIFSTRTAAGWEDFFAGHGIEGITCLTSAEWMQHPQAVETKIVDDFDDPVLGRFQGPGINPRLSDTPGDVRWPRPKLDSHRDEILREASAPQPARPAEGEALRSALQGIKVLDLGIILASPTCGRTLAEFGADVIKIDSPHRNPVSWHNDINRGKRSIIIDMKRPEGMAIFWKLVDQADVVLENFRKGVADKLGIGYEHIRKRRPEIVYCSINAYGMNGPYANRPGREVFAQALSGMQERYGGDKPAVNPLNGNDYGAGVLSAFGVAMALWNRNRTGKGQYVNTALAYSATTLQSSLLQQYEGKRWDYPRGLKALGTGPLNRAYKAGDGWLFLSARSGNLADCKELADLAHETGTTLEKRLEERLAGGSVQQWVDLLNRADIGSHRVTREFEELTRDPNVLKRGLILVREHDEIGLVTTTGPSISLSRTPVTAGVPAPKPGKDAASILAEIGMSDELERLVRERIVVVDGIKPGGPS